MTFDDWWASIMAPGTLPKTIFVRTGARLLAGTAWDKAYAEGHRAGLNVPREPAADKEGS